MAYTYDALGNRSALLDNLTMTSYTVNNLNQYTQADLNSYAYDTNGSLTSDGIWTFGYDRVGHLISASKSGTSASYKYDALGRRIEKIVNGTVTKYVYSGQSLIEERDGSNNVTAKYIYAGGIDNPVEVIKGPGAYFFQQDALGSITALTNSSGAIVESYTYDAFGKPKIKDGSGNLIDIPSTPFLFTGREYDAETGLYHYRTRAYSPELGRFLQMDSIGFGGADVNLYRYVANNPVNYRDPSGRFNPLVIPAAIGIGAAVRVGEAYLATHGGGADAVTLFPYLPFVMKNPEASQMSAPFNAVLDAHEAVHQGSWDDFTSEKNAYIQTVLTANKYLNEGYKGKQLTECERNQVQGARDASIDALRDMGINIDDAGNPHP